MATGDPNEGRRNLDTAAAVSLGWTALSAALGDVSSKHGGLFRSKANERAITHVLACCFERHFTDLVKDLVVPEVPWSIDCEYNRILAKHSSKSQPYGFLLERLAVLQHQKGTAKSEQWRMYLSEFEDKLFDNKRKKLEFDRKGSRRALIAMKKIVPDVILHQRTLNDPDNNAIAVEVKPAWADSEDTLFDLIKLSAFTTGAPGISPTYQRGVFLHFDGNGVLVPGQCWLFDLDAGEEPTAIA